MMMTYHKALPIFKTCLFVFASIFFLSSCQEEEFIENPENTETSPAKAVVSDSNAESLTITGTYAILNNNIECSTCTYIVPANTLVIDGLQLALKPGSVICLDAVLKYGNLEFVNLEGTEEAPITIGSCH